MHHAQRPGEVADCTVKLDPRRTGRLAEDLHVMPGQTIVPTRSERLEYGLFRGKPAREVRDRIRRIGRAIALRFREATLLKVPIRALRSERLEIDKIDTVANPTSAVRRVMGRN